MSVVNVGETTVEDDAGTAKVQHESNSAEAQISEGNGEESSHVKQEQKADVEEGEKISSKTEETEEAGNDLVGTSSPKSADEELDKHEEPTPKQGLLDKPLVIEGKRERHSVNRLVSTPTPVAKKTLGIAGSGKALGEIEYVNANLSKVYSEGLKSLHKLCYGGPGVSTTRKRDLRKFNGFSFAVDSPEFEKKKISAMKLNSSEVRDIRKMLGTEGGQSKAEAVMNILKFLQKPRDLGLKTPESRKRKSTSRSSKGVKKAKKVGGKKSKKVSADDEKDDSESDEDVHSAEEEKKAEKTPVSKKGKISKRSAGIKLKKPVEKVQTDTALPTKTDSANWGPGGPTDEEVNSTINEILHSVDLVNCTMKQMCERISNKFPNLDMVKNKKALKERVKEALEEMEDA